jgi:hypothetical protein
MAGRQSFVVVLLENAVVPGVASILRTGVAEVFVPKGLNEGS